MSVHIFIAMKTEGNDWQLLQLYIIISRSSKSAEDPRLHRETPVKVTEATDEAQGDDPCVSESNPAGIPSFPLCSDSIRPYNNIT